ncbi:hypothetical protein M758_1G291800 [Ceratodon purpureus]|nr:hypothetical protein M758_1G291800 [Ceratodon purpureus]
MITHAHEIPLPGLICPISILRKLHRNMPQHTPSSYPRPHSDDSEALRRRNSTTHIKSLPMPGAWFKELKLLSVAPATTSSGKRPPGDNTCTTTLHSPKSEGILTSMREQ